MEEIKDIKELNERLEDLNHQLYFILLVNEINKILNYKNDILDQLIEHNNGNIINIMQKIFINYVCISLCAIWDKPKSGRNEKSIPSIIELININEVKDRDLLTRINKMRDIIINCKILKQMKNHRNKNIAHNLIETRQEKITENGEILKLKYGFEP